MHSAVLCIGSNVESARVKIEDAICRLRHSGVYVEETSDIYTVNMPYYNCVVRVATTLDADTLVTLTKTIERDMHRTKEMKAISIVPIDLDLVVFDEKVLRIPDYETDYFKKGYAQIRH